MPTLPWTTVAVAEPTRSYVMMASCLPLARYRSVPAFMRDSLQIRRQLAKTPGLIGYSLDAQLLRKTFWTLSAWESREALAAFDRADPHRDRVERIRPRMQPTTFAFWTALGAELPLDWGEARRRLAAAR